MMENAATKNAILDTMAVALREGQVFAWHVLDRLFRAMATDGSAALAERLEDDRLNREAHRERSLDNVAREDDRPEEEADERIPAWATASDGRAGP